MNCEGQTANNYCPCVLQTSLLQVGIIPGNFFLTPTVSSENVCCVLLQLLTISSLFFLFLYWGRAGEGVGGGGGGDGGGGNGGGSLLQFGCYLNFWFSFLIYVPLSVTV